jgi:hypothetical protein
MAKILSDYDILDIIGMAVTGEELCGDDVYTNFLQDISGVIVKYFGGSVGRTEFSEEESFTEFHITEEVPSDGGVYKRYDTDVRWENGKEFKKKEECDK